MSIINEVKAGGDDKSVDDWLDSVDYKSLNEGNYIPTDFALKFMLFIQLVNGEQGESNTTPVVHLKMLDKIIGKKERIANLCHRGLGKTTLFIEYLFPFLCLFPNIPGFGEVDGMIYVSDSMDNGVKSARKNIEHRYLSSDWLQEWIPEATFTDKYIEMTSKSGYTIAMKMFGAKTGIRGTKIFGKRPVLCVLDDLVSDDDAKSQVSMEAIKDTVYKGVDYALDPNRKKIIFNGTPFAKTDILYEAVESGAWHVNVWPVCEKFPCSREEFQGSWPERFSYDHVKSQYDASVKTGKLAAFNQEYMLRISSSEERLISDNEIQWYSRQQLLKQRQNYNFYITTDFAVSDKETADFSVISVWAHNANGDWFWVDGMCRRQTADKSVHDLFRYAQLYKPQTVGVETSGQQRVFIEYLKAEMMHRNNWFTLAGKVGREGINPIGNKLARFNMVVPMFKAGKIYFPTEAKGSIVMNEFMSEIRLATINGLKGKDDCLDTISMLMQMNAWRPSEEVKAVFKEEEGMWDLEEGLDDPLGGLSSYIV